MPNLPVQEFSFTPASGTALVGPVHPAGTPAADTSFLRAIHGTDRRFDLFTDGAMAMTPSPVLDAVADRSALSILRTDNRLAGSTPSNPMVHLRRNVPATGAVPNAPIWRYDQQVGTGSVITRMQYLENRIELRNQANDSVGGIGIAGGGNVMALLSGINPLTGEPENLFRYYREAPWTSGPIASAPRAIFGSEGVAGLEALAWAFKSTAAGLFEYEGLGGGITGLSGISNIVSVIGYQAGSATHRTICVHTASSTTPTVPFMVASLTGSGADIMRLATRTTANVFTQVGAFTQGGQFQLASVRATAFLAVTDAAGANGFSLYRGGTGIMQLWDAAGGTSATQLLFGNTLGFVRVSTTGIQARNGANNAFVDLQGQLQTHANAVAETITPTHTITIKDASGTTYRVPCRV